MIVGKEVIFKFGRPGSFFPFPSHTGWGWFHHFVSFIEIFFDILFRQNSNNNSHWISAGMLKVLGCCVCLVHKAQMKITFPPCEGKTHAQQKFVQFDNVTGDTERRWLSTYNLRPRKRNNLFEDEDRATKVFFSDSDQGQLNKGARGSCVVVLKRNRFSELMSDATQRRPGSERTLGCFVSLSQAGGCLLVFVAVRLTQPPWKKTIGVFLLL